MHKSRRGSSRGWERAVEHAEQSLFHHASRDHSINIAVGHDDESVAREVVEAIWETKGAFCKVRAGMRDLDADFPSYSLDEASFDEWQQGKDGE
ncbi:MAG: hypothetical protein GY778_15555 [bacterium]|nr:hypothetical protein [bacterium]